METRLPLPALEPESECWHRALMRAYTAAGEVGLALRQYDAVVLRITSAGH